MNMNNIGKFEMLKISNEFDATLTHLYGVNMLDAGVLWRRDQVFDIASSASDTCCQTISCSPE